MEKKDFPQVSRKTTIVMLHRSLESINFKWGAANFQITRLKNSLVPRNLKLNNKEMKSLLTHPFQGTLVSPDQT